MNQDNNFNDNLNNGIGETNDFSTPNNGVFQSNSLRDYGQQGTVNSINAQSNVDNVESNSLNSQSNIGNVVENNYSNMSFNSDNNNFPQHKNKKGKKKVNIYLIVAILVVISVFVVLKYIVKSDNSKVTQIFDKKEDTIDINWKITLKGKEYKLPVNLKKITNNGLYYYTSDGEKLSESNMDYKQPFSLNPEGMTIIDDGYKNTPDAGFSSYVTKMEFYLVPKNGASDNYSDYTVAGFSATDVSKDFFSVNGVGCGSTIDEIIKALNLDVNDDNVEIGEGYLKYLSYVNEAKNITIDAYADSLHDSDKVFQFEIFINDRDYLEK